MAEEADMTDNGISKGWWTKVIALVGLSFGAALLTVSCGDGGSSGGPVTTDSTCSVGGTKCAGGCTPTVGCAECATNLDCNEAGKPICVLGKCQECGVAADCGAGKSCWPNEFKCNPACAANQDCSGDSPICDLSTGACVGCLSSADCAGVKEMPICEPSHAQCAECASNADCGVAAPACDLNDGKCHECLVDSDCKAPSLCGVDRKCHFSCATNADCADPNKPLCDPGGKDCVECLINTDCGAAAPACAADHKCVQCVVSADCKDPATPVCEGEKCVGCASAADCIDPLKPVCKGGACIQCDKDTDCKDPNFPKCSGQMCGPA